MERKITKIEPKKELFKPKLRVAAYARVSSGKDAMLHSLSAQVSYYKDYITKNREWAFSGVYADEALTGTKQNRPELGRLMDDCRNGKINMIITKAISRFARNTVTMLEYVRELKELGISVYFEEENINTLSKDGELMLTVLSAFAQEQSLNVSEDCKWRIKKQYKQGIQPLSLQKLYGYTRTSDGNFEIVNEEAEVVKYIFTSYLEGSGLIAICKDLNKKGIPSPKGKRWAEKPLKYLITNEKYKGDLLLQKFFVEDHLTKKKRRNKGQKDQYYVENNHVGIISRKTFDAVQAEMERRSLLSKASKNPPTHDFTGLIRCMNCGKNYQRKISHPRDKYRRVFWNCVTFLREGKEQCYAKQIPEEILETLTADVLSLSKFDPDVMKTKISEIQIPEWNKVRFILKNGNIIEKEWQDRSRKDSWTAEMKQKASEYARKGC